MMQKGLITTQGVEMEYFSFGENKRAFVILPGIDTQSVVKSAEAVAAAYRAFGERYTVYVFDRRSDMPDAYSIWDMAHDTAAVMRVLGIRDADIFGASQGGMIALCLALQAPELVNAMVLGSTCARSDGGAKDIVARWIALAERRDLQGLTLNFIDNLYADDTIRRFRDLLIHRNDHVTDDDLRRFIIGAHALYGFDVTDRLSEIRCPVLVIGSEGDRVIPPAATRALADGLHCACYFYGSEYGHCVFDEAPDYKDRMLRFFGQYDATL